MYAIIYALIFKLMLVIYFYFGLLILKHPETCCEV